MTPQQAKNIIRAELERRGLSFEKLTARTIGFQDLARANCVFVKIHGWQANIKRDVEGLPVPTTSWDELRQVAVSNGFRIE